MKDLKAIVEYKAFRCLIQYSTGNGQYHIVEEPIVALDEEDASRQAEAFARSYAGGEVLTTSLLDVS